MHRVSENVCGCTASFIALAVVGKNAAEIVYKLQIVFGAEPKDYEVYEYYYSLQFSPAVVTVVKETIKNPKCYFLVMEAGLLLAIMQHRKKKKQNTMKRNYVERQDLEW